MSPSSQITACSVPTCDGSCHDPFCDSPGATRYAILRRRLTPTGDLWLPVKRGLTKEKAEALVAAAKWDLRYCYETLRVEEDR